MHLWLLAATPALRFAPLTAVPAFRVMSPVMYADEVVESPMCTSSRGRVVPTKAASPVLVQRGDLRTWAMGSPYVEQVQVGLSNEGAPLEAEVELVDSRDLNICRMRVWSEDGDVHPMRAVMPTPGDDEQTIGVNNLGTMDLPIAATVANYELPVPRDVHPSCMRVEGGEMQSYGTEPFVDTVQVLLVTDGEPLDARVELVQGPDLVRQTVDLFSEDGLDLPLLLFLETPGDDYHVRVVNNGPRDAMLSASVDPYYSRVPRMGRGRYTGRGGRGRGYMGRGERFMGMGRGERYMGRGRDYYERGRGYMGGRGEYGDRYRYMGRGYGDRYGDRYYGDRYGPGGRYGMGDYEGFQTPYGYQQADRRRIGGVARSTIDGPRRRMPLGGRMDY